MQLRNAVREGVTQGLSISLRDDPSIGFAGSTWHLLHHECDLCSLSQQQHSEQIPVIFVL